MKLPTGKVPIEVLKKIVFKNLGAKRLEVVLGPSVGFDGAVLDLGCKSLIVSMDPITGTVERIGWLAVHVNANDVATFGVEPAFFSSCILLPEHADEQTVKTICSQMNKASKDIGMAIIGGHCEVTPNLSNPIVIGCAMGTTEKGKYVTAGGAKPGNKLILTKSAGVEGTAILATEHYNLLLKNGLSPSLLKGAQRFFEKISVVKEAILAFKTGGVTAMHDPTEGGILGGVHEMADASELGVKIFEEKIPVAVETIEICRFYGIDPLQLISSGALLIASREGQAEKIVEELGKNGIDAAIIGEFLPSKRQRLLIRKNGEITPLPRPEADHLWLALAKYR
ncbi:MAG: AIR synthase family protein [Candidatus Bathyarchaeia archaeon]